MGQKVLVKTLWRSVEGIQAPSNKGTLGVEVMALDASVTVLFWDPDTPSVGEPVIRRSTMRGKDYNGA